MSFSYYEVNTIRCVLDPSFIVKAIRFCYRGSTDTEKFKIHAVLKALPSVVDTCTVPSLDNLWPVLE